MVGAGQVVPYDLRRGNRESRYTTLFSNVPPAQPKKDLSAHFPIEMHHFEPHGKLSDIKSPLDAERRVRSSNKNGSTFFTYL